MPPWLAAVIIAVVILLAIFLMTKGAGYKQRKGEAQLVERQLKLMEKYGGNIPSPEQALKDLQAQGLYKDIGPKGPVPQGPPPPRR